MFLEDQIWTLEALHIRKSEVNIHKQILASDTTIGTVVPMQFAQRQGSRKTCCSLCHGEHYVLFCEDFKRKDSKAKKKFSVTNRTPDKGLL